MPRSAGSCANFLLDVIGDIGHKPDPDLDRLALENAEAGFHKIINVEILRHFEGLIGRFEILNAIHGKYANILAQPAWPIK